MPAWTRITAKGEGQTPRRRTGWYAKLPTIWEDRSRKEGVILKRRCLESVHVTSHAEETQSKGIGNHFICGIAGFFLPKLCLQNYLYGARMIPSWLIQESKETFTIQTIVGASERGNYLYTLGSNSKNPYKKKAVKKKVKNRNKIYKMKQRTNEATFYQWDDSWKGGYRKEISFNVFRHFSNVMNVSARQCKKVFLSPLSNGIDFKWCKNRYTD